MFSRITFVNTLFKGLSQKDLTVDNKAEPNRLNIRPMWASRMDENGEIQRFDFKRGENECPESILEWESFKQLVDNGTLAIKGSLSQAKAQADTKSLEEIKRLEAEKIEKAINDKDYIITLEIEGKEYTSVEFAEELRKIEIENSNITFIIGGSYGLADSIKQKAKMHLVEPC